VATGNEPSLAKDFDMVMLVLPGGIERTEAEYRVLLEEAGFQLSSVYSDKIGGQYCQRQANLKRCV
jgi:hypothetical protein